MRLHGSSKFLAPVMLTGLSLLALTFADRRLDDLTQEIEVRDGYNNGYRSMKLLGKFKRPKSQIYPPAKSHQKPKYHPPPLYAPPKPHYIPPQHLLIAPPHYGPPKHQYGPPKPQHGPPKHQYGPPKPHYGPPKTQYGPPKVNYRAPTPAYGPPQPAYHPIPPYVKPQQPYAAAPPANAIYSPPQQVYAQPSSPYLSPPYNPAPPPPPSVPYAQLPIAPPAFSPSALVTYSAAEPPLPQTDYNQPDLTLLNSNSPASTDDDDGDDSSESTSSDDSSASSYNAPHTNEPAEPKPSDDEHSVSDQVEAAPLDINPPVAVYVSTESSVHLQDPPKQTEFIPSYPHYSDDTDNNHPETDDSSKQDNPNHSAQETDNSQQGSVDPPKGTEAEINSPVEDFPEDANDEIPTISPPISTDEALAYSPNFGDNSAFPESTDHDFPSIFNLPSNFYKQTGTDADQENDFGFFQLGIFPKTGSFFEQNYNG